MSYGLNQVGRREFTRAWRTFRVILFGEVLVAKLKCFSDANVLVFVLLLLGTLYSDIVLLYVFVMHSTV